MYGNGADNKLDGGAGNDYIKGRAGGDTLIGNIGHDRLEGEAGNDTLKGGLGVDILEGGLGADIMFGEGDKDYFLCRIYDKAELAVVGNDIINGFQTGIDKIELTTLLEQFGIDAASALDGGFVRLTKVGADTLVQFDQDGTAGSAPPLTMATVVNATVVATDLYLDAYVIS